MTIEQWADETKAILEYWLDDTIECRFIKSSEQTYSFNGYVCEPYSFPKPLDAAVYIIYWIKYV